MKTIKKAFAMLLAVVMVLGLSVTAFAEETAYSITVKNTPSSTNVSIVGKTFSAYKIFDVSYADTDNTAGNDAFAYTISNSSSWFAPVMQYMGYTKGTGDNADKWGKIPEGGTWTAETNSYYTGGGLKLTPTASDSTKYVVETTVDSQNKTEFGDDQARALADFLTTWLNKQTTKLKADGTGVGAAVTPATTPATEQAVISNLSAPGYYLVTGSGTADDNQTVVAAAALFTTDPTAEINLKANAPTVDKDIDGSNDTDDTTKGNVDYNNAAVGDSVPYVVTSKVPDMTGYSKYYFVVTDTLSEGLSFNYDVAVKIDGTTKSGIYVKTETVNGAEKTTYSSDGKEWKDSISEVDSTKTSVTDYDYVVYVPGDSGATFEIVFTNFIQYKESVGKTIEITYSATVNEDAVIGKAGNKNDVTLTYSNNPGTTDNGDNTNPNKPTGDSPVGVTPKSTTYTYVTGIELIKVDPDGNRLTGAQFKITGEKLNTVLVETEEFTKANDGTYWALKDGSYTTIAPVYADGTTYESNKYYTYDENSGTYTEYSGDMTDYDGDPVLYCKPTDSSNTTYVQYTGYLYTSLSDKYTKTVTKTPIVKSTDVSYTGTVGADGVLSFDGLSAGTYTITEIVAPDGYNLLTSPITVVITCTVPTENSTSTDCTWTATDGSGTDAKSYNVTADGVVQITVENSTGTELPQTGGIGTTIFYVVGFILVIGAAVLLITKKRMNGSAE